MRILEYMSHLASNSTAALDPSTCTGNLLQCLGFKIISIVESACQNRLPTSFFTNPIHQRSLQRCRTYWFMNLSS